MISLFDLKNQTGRQKGFALLIVLTALLIVTILANIILSVVLNHARLTRHRVTRIQAYYAAQMGMVYAMAKLKAGWVPANPDNWYITRRLCTTSPNSSKCTQDQDLPPAINLVNITIKDGAPGYPGLYNITAVANYTYNNP